MNQLTLVAETADTVTLRRCDFEALLETLEDLQDIATLEGVDRRLAAGDTETLPLEMAERLIAGENRVRVWREHRGMTQVELADRSGISRAYLAEIETGRKPGSAAALKALAAVLRLPMEDLVPDDR